MDTTKDRLLAFIEAMGISRRAFEVKCGISEGYIKNLKSSPSTNIVGKILRSFPELNQTWLLSGSGPMLLDAAGASSPAPAAEAPADPPPAGDGDLAATLARQAETMARLAETMSKQADIINDQSRQIGHLVALLEKGASRAATAAAAAASASQASMARAANDA